ncbi:uncharacterized protein LOC127875281 isoform X2 [Dreissena polymorpha]|uniref:uncharacterized protein LOC127875281 isoform X2 n=1 Tax=Dreissena polymorpha TaxID=45954 RepID=UPI0022643E8E|nr:uncharacterized protein LOC127875281 isoform X2 [Dreissena polymorpha]
MESTIHCDDSGCSRENVPLLKTSYRAYCRAYYMLVDNWLAGTIGSGVPNDDYDVRVIRNAVDDSVRDLTISAEDESTSGLEEVQRVYDHLVVLCVPGHLRTVVSHRRWLDKCYQLCVKIGVKLSDNMKDHILRHDLSKFSPMEALGYAVMFGDGSVGFRKLETLEEQTEWDLALKHHYAHNCHHPEYFRQDRQGGVSVVQDRRESMENDSDGSLHLDESILDMMAARGERELKHDHVISIQKLLDMPVQYLRRYTDADRKYVTQTMVAWSEKARNFMSVEGNAHIFDGLFDERHVVY